MALVWKDKVAETSTTTGTGAFTLAWALTGYRTFGSVCSTNDTVYYSITAVDANGVPSGEWETGLGTYSGANTLTRTTVLDSSNSGAVVSFSAGTKRVAVSAVAATQPRVISRQVTSGSAVSVTFSSIPQIFEDLRVVIMGRSAIGTQEGSVYVTFNGDTGSNYDYTRTAMYQSSVTGGSGFSQTSMNVAGVCGSSAPAGASSLVNIYIPSYMRTTFHKTVITDSGEKKFSTAQSFAYVRWAGTSTWHSTNAITSITVSTDTNWVDDTVVTLIGIP